MTSLGLLLATAAGWQIARASAEATPVSPVPASLPASAPAGQRGGRTLDVPTSLPAGIPPYAAYGGSGSCAECHERAYEEWRQSHHAKAQRLLLPELDHEAFEPRRTIHHGTQTATAEVQNGRYTITTIGSEGKPRSFEPIGVIGVAPLWQYLIPAPGGRLQVTELAFDPEKKDWFNVYEDEDRQHWEWGHWSQRGMNWNNMCAACHTTGYRKNYDADRDAYRSTYVELGIGCEQCHGPMRDHVDWQNAHPDQEGDPTLKPFDRETHFSICGSCHARRADLTGDFQPGEKFVEHYDLVLPDTSDVYYPDGQVHEEDFEFAAFNLSFMRAWGVRCTDCHFWHTGKVAKEDNRLCQRCHERGITTKIPIDEVEHSHHPKGKEGFFCVDCHMPQTVYMARHWRRDHGMTIPDPLLTKEHGIPNACTRCHEEEGLDWSIDYVKQWYGERMDRPTRHRARLLARLKKGDMDAVPGVLDLLKNETNPVWRAAYAKFLVSAIGGAGQEATRMAVLDAMTGLLDDADPQPQGAALEILEPRTPELAERIAAKRDSPHRLVRIKAAWAMRSQWEPDTPATRDLKRFLAYNWDQPTGAFQWANLLADTNRAEESLPWYEKAIGWDPAAAAFRHSYAVTLHALGKSQTAIAQLHKASEIEPDQVAYPYALGLLYAELGQLQLARDALRTVVDKDDSQGRFWYNLALAEAKVGNLEAAVDALHEAEALQPQVADYPYARATIHYQLKEYGEMRAALERTLEINADHPQAKALLFGH